MMDEFKKQTGYMNDIIEMTETLGRISATFDKRISDMKNIIKECDKRLADIMHFSEYFADRDPKSEEFEAIGREVSRLRTKRRDAKKALYVLEKNVRVSKGMLPALEYANEQFEKPHPLGDPDYSQYWVRNSASFGFIEKNLPSLDMNNPVSIKKMGSSMNDVEGPTPSELDLHEAVEKEVEEALIDEPKKEPQEMEKVAKVRKQGASFVVLNGIDPVFRSTKFMDLVNYLMDDHQCGLCRFDQKSYQSLETFAKSFRSGKQRGADHVNHKDFEKLYANSYFEA